MKFLKRRTAVLFRGIAALLCIGFLSVAPLSEQAGASVEIISGETELVYPLIASDAFIAVANETVDDKTYTVIYHDFVGDLKILYARPLKSLSPTQPDFRVLTCSTENLSAMQTDDMRKTFVRGATANLMKLIKDEKSSPFSFKPFDLHDHPAVLLSSSDDIMYAPYTASFLLAPRSLSRAVAAVFNADKITLSKEKFLVVVLFGKLLFMPASQQGYSTLSTFALSQIKDKKRNLVSNKIYLLTEDNVTLYEKWIRSSHS